MDPSCSRTSRGASPKTSEFFGDLCSSFFFCGTIRVRGRHFEVSCDLFFFSFFLHDGSASKVCYAIIRNACVCVCVGVEGHSGVVHHMYSLYCRSN